MEDSINFLEIAQQIMEIIATITGILAVYFQTKEKVIAWPFAIISVTLLAVVFFHSNLYSDFGLHIIFLLLNIYGWILWTSKSDGTFESIKNLDKTGWGISIGLSLLGTFSLGYIMSTFTDADLSYFDAFTTSTSLVAQFLLAKKYLQNWTLWIVVDVVAVPMYLYKGLYFTAFLFLIFLGLCVIGYREWKKKEEDFKEMDLA